MSATPGYCRGFGDAVTFDHRADGSAFSDCNELACNELARLRQARAEIAYLSIVEEDDGSWPPASMPVDDGVW